MNAQSILAFFRVKLAKVSRILPVREKISRLHRGVSAADLCLVSVAWNHNEAF